MINRTQQRTHSTWFILFHFICLCVKTRTDDYLWLKIQKWAQRILKFAWTVKPVQFTLWISTECTAAMGMRGNCFLQSVRPECKLLSVDFPARLSCGSSPSSTLEHVKAETKRNTQCNEGPESLDFLLLLRRPWLFHTDGQENIDTHNWDPLPLSAAPSQLHCTDPSGSQSGAAPVNLDKEKFILIRLPCLCLKSSNPFKVDKGRKQVTG